MAGYQVGDTCYADVPTALDAYAAQVSGHVIGGGTSGYLVTASRLDNTQIVLREYNLSTGSETSAVLVSPSLPPCAKLDTVEGLQLSWMVIGVWLAAWAFTQYRKAIPA